MSQVPFWYPFATRAGIVVVPTDGASAAVPTFTAPTIGHWSSDSVVLDAAFPGGKVQTWTDLGPWANHLTQPSGSARGSYAYDPAIKRYIVQGDGSSFWSIAQMKEAGGANLSLYPQFTLIVVARLYSSVSNCLVAGADVSGLDNTQVEFFNSSAGPQLLFTTKNTSFAHIPYPNITVAPVVDPFTRWNYFICKHSSAQRSIALNGGTPAVTVGSEIPAALKSLFFGRLSGSAAYFLVGAIARVILLGGDISSGEETALATFFRTYYGVTA